MISSTGMCPACKGRVRNVEGRRHTMERLWAIHRVACPQSGATRKTDKDPHP